MSTSLDLIPKGPFQNASSLLLTVVTVHRLLRPLCGSKWQFDEDKNTFKWRGAANLFNACAAPWLLSFIGAASLWKHVFAASASFGAFQRKICHVFFVWLFFFSYKKTKKKNTHFGEIVTLKDRQPNEPTSSVIEWAFSVSSAKCEEAMINACIFFFFETALKQARDGGEKIVNGFTWLKLYTISSLKRSWLEVFPCSGVLIAQLSSFNSLSVACMGDEWSRSVEQWAKSHCVFLSLATCDMIAVQHFLLRGSASC